MRIDFITIVLDGMPFITSHLSIFNSLPANIDWHWHIVEGVALNIKDTSWCKKLSPRLSNDGTHEYINSICCHPKVHCYHKYLWEGKVEMVNAPLRKIDKTDLIWEIDSDEIWTAQKIETMSLLFKHNLDRNCADFYCRYFISNNILVEWIPGTWTNNHNNEWRRVWRWFPGFQFTSHEPPLTNHTARCPFTHIETKHRGLVFDHYAYVTEQQLRFKEEYYGYKNAVEQWRKLQRNTVWPIKLKNFFGWITDETTAKQLYEH